MRQFFVPQVYNIVKTKYANIFIKLHIYYSKVEKTHYPVRNLYKSRKFNYYLHSVTSVITERDCNLDSVDGN